MYPKPKKQRRKPEPVIKIKLQDAKECWLCGTTQNLERHHCIHGKGRRSKSERYGLVIYLCHNHHNENIPGEEGVHFDPIFDQYLKRYAQTRFERVYDRTKWMNVFGKSYL